MPRRVEAMMMVFLRKIMMFFDDGLGCEGGCFCVECCQVCWESRKVVAVAAKFEHGTSLSFHNQLRELKKIERVKVCR